MRNVTSFFALLLFLALPASTNSAGLYPTYETRVLSGLVCSECKGCSRGERLAVMHVPLNRAKTPGWWGTGLVDIMTKHRQFAYHNVPMCRWTLPPREDGKAWSPYMVIRHRQTLIEIRNDVVTALDGKTKDPSGGATYFHAKRLGDIWSHLEELSVPQHWHHRFFKQD